jgi:iron complex transport system ATP-binding protein
MNLPVISAQTADELLLELRNVSARYEGSPGKSEPLRGVSLELRAGEMVVALGPNGAGKTTLLRVMSGLQKPIAGEVRVEGAPIESMERGTLARLLAVVHQVENVAFDFSVRDVVMMGRAPHQSGWMRVADGDDAVVERTLERCDLKSLADRPVNTLSGGEQKRVAIARALAQEPRILLLDEPAAFLDVRHQIALFDLLAEEIERGLLACFVVMHDLNAAAQYASRVVLMKDGEVKAQGSIEDVMTYARLKETFDADLYCSTNDLTGARVFLPMRGKKSAPS